MVVNSMNSFNNCIQKKAALKLNPMVSGAILGAGYAASTTHDKLKENGANPDTVAEQTLNAAIMGAPVGSLAVGGAWAAKQGIKNGVQNGASKVGRGLSKLKKYASYEKQAGIMRSVGIPAFVAGGIANASANEIAESNPYLSDPEDAKKYVAGKTLQSAGLTAAAVLGAKKIGKAIKKSAAINVPNSKDIPEDEAIVRDSPNKEEVEQIAEPITNESLKRNKYKDLIEKVAVESSDGYLRPINCEVCGYKGLPKSNTGSCPECGALGGKAVHAPLSVEPFDLDSKERNLTSVWDMAEQAREERLSYYM